jgi:predicted dehydrogenase
MNGAPVSFAVVGLGRSGWDIHVRQLRDQPGARVVAVADTDAQRRRQAGDALGCVALTNLDEILEQSDAEVVVLATPSAGHESETLRCLAAGRHVVVEKPMALTAAGARRMVAAAAATGRHVFPFQNYRFTPEFAAIRNIVASGVLGTLYHVRRYPMAIFNRRNDWQTLARNGGGLMNVHGSHHLDLMLQLLPGRVVDVCGDLRRIVAAGDVEDHVKVLLRTDTGATGDLELSMAQNVAVPMPVWIVCGTAGTLTSDGNVLTVRSFDPAAAPPLVVNEGAAQDRRYGNNETLPWREQRIDVATVPAGESFIANLISVLRQGATPLVRPESVCEMIEVMERVRASAGGRAVTAE